MSSASEIPDDDLADDLTVSTLAQRRARGHVRLADRTTSSSQDGPGIDMVDRPSALIVGRASLVRRTVLATTRVTLCLSTE